MSVGDDYYLNAKPIERTPEAQAKWDASKAALRSWGKEVQRGGGDAPSDFLVLDDKANGKRKVDGRRKEEIVGSFNAGCVWQTGSEKYAKHGALKLHSEIIEFCDFVCLRDIELNQRKLLVEAVEEIVQSLWPEATVCVHGSLSTGLMLPTSDIDLVVFNISCDIPEGLQQIATRMNEAGMLNSVEVITKTRVPIVKFVSVDGIPGDICINQESGLHTARIVQEYTDRLPFVRHLVLLLKYFLAQRNLNETYSGGIGSFLLTIMVIALVQHEVKKFENKPLSHLNLGSMLLAFFEFYGQTFNYVRTGISIRNSGFFFSKLSRKWSDTSRPYLLSVENPHEREMDVGRSSSKIIACRSAFKWAFQRLVAGIRDGDVTQSLISLIIPTDDFLKSRLELLTGHGETAKKVDFHGTEIHNAPISKGKDAENNEDEGEVDDLKEAKRQKRREKKKRRKLEKQKVSTRRMKAVESGEEIELSNKQKKEILKRARSEENRKRNEARSEKNRKRKASVIDNEGEASSSKKVKRDNVE